MGASQIDGLAGWRLAGMTKAYSLDLRERVVGGLWPFAADGRRASASLDIQPAVPQLEGADRPMRDAVGRWGSLMGQPTPDHVLNLGLGFWGSKALLSA